MCALSYKKFDPVEIYELMQCVKCFIEIGHSTNEDNWGEYYHYMWFENGDRYNLNVDETEELFIFMSVALRAKV